MEPPIKLERFAALSAEIDLGAPRDDVIAREKIPPETWEEAQEIWLAKMADEASRKRFEITNRYNTTFVATRRVLEAKRARPPRPKKEPPAPKRKKEAAPPPVEAAEPVPPLVAASLFGADLVARAPERAPGPVQVAPPPFIAPPAGPAIALPGPAIAPPAYAPPLAAPSPPVAAPSPAPPAVVARKDHPLESTASPITASPAGGPLPFRPGDGAAAIPRAAAAKPAKRNAGKTMAFTAPVTAETLPFQQPGKAAPGSPSSPAKTAPTPMGASGSSSPAPPVPVRATPPSGAPPAAAPGPAPAAKKIDLSSTMGLPGDGPSLSSSTPLPFSVAGGAAKPGAAAGSRFTMEQFASLTAEISAAPTKIGEVRARYGLDEASHRAEAERWQRLFAADKDLFARYTEAFQRYREWLARGRR